MSQFFISCKESRIESNRSFYGCFYLGPFEPSQSITIANALRRTLLSELFGLGIVSVEIEGATHEYASIPGIKDSVLDILLNLKEIVLKKTLKNFKPQIGYLRVRGPGIVRASHLRLPPFIQCVDPDQYIATLAENGSLNMKFIIQYGNKWLSPLNALRLSEDTAGVKQEEIKEGDKISKTMNAAYNPFNLHLKKRRLILKKLKQLGIASSNSYINIIAQNALYLSKHHKKNLKSFKGSTGPTLVPLSNSTPNIARIDIYGQEARKYPAISLKNTLKKLKKYKVEQKTIKSHFTNKGALRTNKKIVFLNSNPLTIDAIFNPINKVNYIIEQNQHRLTPYKIQTSSDFSELYEMLKNANLLSSTTGDKESKNSLNSQLLAEPLVGNQEFENILEIKRDINALKKDITKHNITIEIWTNGSIHPRDALYQGFRNLIKLFVTLKNVKTIDISDKNSALKNLISSSLTDSGLERNEKTIIKKLKMRETLSTTPLAPLNETSFLSTYVAPKLNNYYLHSVTSQSTLLSKPSLHIKKNLDFSGSSKTLNEFDKDNSKKNNLKKENHKTNNNLDIGFLNLSLHSYASLKRLKINTIEELAILLKNENENSAKILKQLNRISIKEIELRMQTFCNN